MTEIKATGEGFCRLCLGGLRDKFSLLTLGQHEVRYYECTKCGSLQTEKPHWLKQAYDIPGVHIDVAQACRNVQTWIKLIHIFRQIDFSLSQPCLDYGGSSGFLARLMRDTGYDFRTYDAFERAKFANYFVVSNLMNEKFSIVTAFEVFEHFAEPRSALREIFDIGADAIIFTTQFYEGQSEDWGYLVPECGQHVFFYTRDALESYAQEWGYELLRVFDFGVLVRRDGLLFNRFQRKFETPTAKSAGELVQSVTVGTEFTYKDFCFAKERFVADLPKFHVHSTSSRIGLIGKILSWFKGRLPKMISN